jgi:hypothetical protein
MTQLSERIAALLHDRLRHVLKGHLLVEQQMRKSFALRV